MFWVFSLSVGPYFRDMLATSCRKAIHDVFPSAKGRSNKYVRTSYTAHADGRATQNYRTRAYVLNGLPLTKTTKYQIVVSVLLV